MLKTALSLLPQRLQIPIKKFARKFFNRPLGREELADVYLKGQGIEIGALHQPLALSRHARVKYVDRFSLKDLREHYPELRHLPLVSVDIIDDGEKLSTISNETQDFVIANHFVEHSQNPLLTLTNLFRVLNRGGVLYIALPDKRYTFDKDRPITPLEHLLKDYSQGPEQSKQAHFEEWVRLVNKIEEPIAAKKQLDNLIGTDYSIHFHVWTQSEMLEMFLALKKQLQIAFDIEACLKNGGEFILVLRKN